MYNTNDPHHTSGGQHLPEPHGLGMTARKALQRWQESGRHRGRGLQLCAGASRSHPRKPPPPQTTYRATAAAAGRKGHRQVGTAAAFTAQGPGRDREHRPDKPPHAPLRGRRCGRGFGRARAALRSRVLRGPRASGERGPEARGSNCGGQARDGGIREPLGGRCTKAVGVPGPRRAHEGEGRGVPGPNQQHNAEQRPHKEAAARDAVPGRRCNAHGGPHSVALRGHYRPGAWHCAAR